MRRYEIVLFDMDGTLVDTGLGVTNSVAYALSKLGINVQDRTQLYKFIGPPLAESFSKFYGLDEQQLDRAIAYYRERYRAEGIYENEAYDGMDQCLNTLKNAGVRLAVATSKPEVFAKGILEKMHMNQYFEFVGGATLDHTRNKKIDVMQYVLEHVGDSDRSKILMVGDRHYDINGAKHFRIDSVGVTFGYGSGEELTEAGAMYLVDHAADIVDIVLH
ncbi:MAG: HAD-IA family hydrolase [Wujia sp.]